MQADLREYGQNEQLVHRRMSVASSNNAKTNTPNSIQVKSGRVLWYLAAGLLAALVMAILALTLDKTGRDLLYSTEDSIIEMLTIGFWIALAISIPFLMHQISVSVIAAVGVCLACAAREADLHKAFTEYSVLKIAYYVRDTYPLPDRLLAAVIVGLAIACAIITTLALWRRLRMDNGWSAAWVRIAAIILILAVFSKALDASPERLEDAGLGLPHEARYVMKSLEESMEFMLPVLALVAVIRFSRTAAAAAANTHQGPRWA